MSKLLQPVAIPMLIVYGERARQRLCMASVHVKACAAVASLCRWPSPRSVILVTTYVPGHASEWQLHVAPLKLH